MTTIDPFSFASALDESERLANPMAACFDVAGIANGLSAFLTPAIAIVTAVIVVLQYQLAARSWRLAAYDKRYPVFTEVLDYILFVRREMTMTFERLSQFKREAKNKDFLFNEEVRAFIEELYEKGRDLYADAETIKLSQGTPDESEKALILESGELKQWFKGQDDRAKQLFKQYLSIKWK